MQQTKLEFSVLVLSHTSHAHFAPCSQGEDDTCLLLYMANTVQKGDKKVTMLTVDMDVVVLAVASFTRIAPVELRVAFGIWFQYKLITK